MNGSHGPKLDIGCAGAGVSESINATALCTKCGTLTIDAWREYKAKFGNGARPSYCGQCGQPFPWTEVAIAVARGYTDELDDVTQDDKTTLKATFNDLTIDTPGTELAASRFKRIIGRPVQLLVTL